MKKVSDEEIVACLMACRTMKETATKLGITERSLYERMGNGDFQVIYKTARTQVVQSAIYDLNAHIGEAISTISEIMNDKAVNPSIRIQAANTLIDNAHKFANRLKSEEMSISIQRDENRWEL